MNLPTIEQKLLSETFQIAHDYALEKSNGSNPENIKNILHQRNEFVGKVTQTQISDNVRNQLIGIFEAVGLISIGRDPELESADLVSKVDQNQETDSVSWLMDAADLLSREPEPIRWLVQNLWTAESCGFIAGEPKTGKTWLALEMALSIASGKPVMGKFEVSAAGAVLYIAEEGKTEDLTRRLHSLAKARGISNNDIQNCQFKFAIQRGVRIDTEDWQQKIRNVCELYKPRVIFIDPFVRVHNADENRTKELQPILSFLRRLQVDFHCSVILIHHQRKPKEDDKSRTGQKLRGSGDLYAWLDSALYLEKAKGDDTVQVQVEHRDAGEPEPFLFRLEAMENETRLLYQEGNLKSLKVLELAAQFENYLKTHPGGVLNSELFEAVKGKGQLKSKALNKMIEQGRATKTPEQRSDKGGRSREQMVWRISEGQPHSQIQGSR